MTTRSVLTGILVVALTCGCGQSPPEPAGPATLETTDEPGPLIWKITTKSGSANHLVALPPLGIRLEELPPTLVRQVLNRSTKVAIRGAAKTSSAIRPPGDLRASLGENVWSRLMHAAAGYRLDPEHVKTLSPGFVASFLTQHWLAKNPNPVAAFIERTQKRTLPQIILDVDPVARDDIYGIEYLRYVLAHLAAEQDAVEQRLRLYRAGDAEALARIANHQPPGLDRPDLWRKHYHAIGTKWIERVAPALEAGGVLIALAYDEVLHRQGMLAALRSRGYRVERLGAGTPATLRSRARPRNRLSACRAAVRNAYRLVIAHSKPRYTESQREAALEFAIDSIGLGMINACMNMGADYVACYSGSTTFEHVTGCDNKFGSGGPRQKTDIERSVEQLCACKDAACARSVLDSWVSQGKRFKSGGNSATVNSWMLAGLARCAQKAGIPGDEVMRRLGDLVDSKPPEAPKKPE